MVNITGAKHFLAALFEFQVSLSEGARTLVDHISDIVEQSRLFDLEEQERTPTSEYSRRRNNKAQALVDIRERREEQKQEIGYGSRPFLLCNLPVRKVPQETLVWERRNGNFFLRIEGSPTCGLPYGSDSLIPMLVATF